MSVAIEWLQKHESTKPFQPKIIQPQKIVQTSVQTEIIDQKTRLDFGDSQVSKHTYNLIIKPETVVRRHTSTEIGKFKLVREFFDNHREIREVTIEDIKNYITNSYDGEKLDFVLITLEEAKPNSVIPCMLAGTIINNTEKYHFDSTSDPLPSIKNIIHFLQDFFETKEMQTLEKHFKHLNI